VSQVDNQKVMAKNRSKKKTGSIGMLFWVAFILLIVVIYLYNRPTIERTLENTGLVEVIRNRFGDSDDQRAPQPTVQTPPDIAIDLQPADPEPVIRSPEPTVRPTPPPPQPAPTTEPPSRPAPPSGSSTPRETTPSTSDGDTIARTTDPPVAQSTTRTRVSKIYFIRVTDDGRIFPQEVSRSVTYTNNPMTQTLHALLAGPTASELNAGLLNLVPENTRLISAAVRDGTAYLNFNESFRFNPMGVEGFIAQLQQVVFSTTEFPTINRVQILIEGETVNYLGGDGVYIGAPLDRNSFG
jgi:germination protein M